MEPPVLVKLPKHEADITNVLSAQHQILFLKSLLTTLMSR